MTQVQVQGNITDQGWLWMMMGVPNQPARWLPVPSDAAMTASNTNLFETLKFILESKAHRFE